MPELTDHERDLYDKALELNEHIRQSQAATIATMRKTLEMKDEIIAMLTKALEAR